MFQFTKLLHVSSLTVRSSGSAVVQNNRQAILISPMCRTVVKASMCDVLLPSASSLLDHPFCESIPDLQRSCFYPCPFERDNFRAVRGLDVWKLCVALCLQNLRFILETKLATFGYVVGVFLPRKFKLILRIFKLFSQ
jgi:hypothetical protein